VVGDRGTGFSGEDKVNCVEEFVCMDIVPPLPIKKNVYMCDKYFHIEYIEDLFKTYDDYGIVMIAGEETQFYKMNGTYTLIDSFTLCRQKKQKNGGQSSARFQRIHDNQVMEYVKKICERFISNYWDKENNKCTVKALIIGGIGDIKDKVVVSDWLNPKLKSIIKRIINLNTFDIEKLIESCSDVVEDNKVGEQNNLMNKFYDIIENDPSKIIYGLNELKEAVNNGMIQELLIHHNIMEQNKEIIEKAMILGSKVYIIEINNDKSDKLLNGYGGLLGITWFSQRME